MPDNGVTTVDLTAAVLIDQLVGNSEGSTVLINIERIAAQLRASLGPDVETRAMLFADLGWPSGALGTVWGDATPAYIGVYKKAGAVGAGSWARIGDTPQQLMREAASRIIPVLTISTSSGTANAQVGSLPSGITAYSQGLQILWYPDATNTGAITLALGGLSALPVLSEGAQPLAAGKIVSGRPYVLRCANSGTEWRIVSRGSWDAEIAAALTVKPDRNFTLATLSSDGGTPNAQVVSGVPVGMTAYGGGQSFFWIPNATNTTPDPTLDVAGFGVRTLKGERGQTLAAGDVVNGAVKLIRISLTDTIRVLGPLPSEIDAAAEVSPLLARNSDAAQVNLSDWTLHPYKESQVTRIVLDDGTPAVQVSGLNQAGNFSRTPRDAINGSTFSAGAVVASSDIGGRILVMQRTAALTEIRDLSDGNGDYRVQLNITAGMADAALSVLDKPLAPTCAFVDLYVGITGGTGTIKVKENWVSAGASRFSFATPDFFTGGRVAYVSPTGVLGANGRSDAPMNTLRRAMATGASTIVLTGGVYDAANMMIDGNLFGGATLMAESGDMPIIRGGEIVTGFTAVAGRTDVYSAALAVAPVTHNTSTPKGFVWLMGTPWSAISAADRRAQHNGRSHRIPHAPFYAGPTNLDTLEAATRVSWWWSSGVLYVRSVPGVDPLTMAVRVPRGDATVNRRQQNQIEMQGIAWEFVGITLDNTYRYDLDGVTVIGAPFDGLSLDFVSGTDRFCTVVGSSNDNWNGHGTTGDTPGRTDGYVSIDYRLHSIEPYSALAWDDGRSLHERGRGRVDGGLFEYCGSTACAPAGGAEETYHGTEIAYCGWDTGAGSGGERAGIAIVNAVIDDGTGTRAECRGVVIRDCPRGFYVGVGASHRMELWDTWTKGCSEHALFAAVSAASLIHHNHRDIGSAALKGGPGVAGIVADNGTLVA